MPRKKLLRDPAEPKPPRRSRRSSHALDAAVLPGSLADRVLQLLRDRGLSARELSLRAGLSGDAVRSLLRGRIESPRAQSLVQLAAALGVTVDSLTAGTVHVPDGVAVPLVEPPPSAVLDVDVPEVDLRVRGGKPLQAEILKAPRRRTWRIPADLLEERGLDPKTVAIIRIGGSGEPGYGPTDRVVVDTAARRATGGALLVVHQDGEEHVLVRVAAGHVHSVGRGRIEFPADGDGEGRTDEVVGTVVGRWAWS